MTAGAAFLKRECVAETKSCSAPRSDRRVPVAPGAAAYSTPVSEGRTVHVPTDAACCYSLVEKAASEASEACKRLLTFEC